MARKTYDRGDAKPWRVGMVENSKGEPKASVFNVVHVLEHHPDWEGVFALDAFSNQIRVVREPPITRNTDTDLIKDVDDISVAVWFGNPANLGLSVSTRIVHEAITEVAKNHTFNPMRKWLDGLEWDGVERLPTLFSDHFGAEQNEYTAKVGIYFLVSPVARVYEPGCKVDQMVVLEGEQGIGKSMSIETLFGRNWTAVAMESPGNKDFYQTMQGRSCIIIEELASFRRSEIGIIKRAITTSYDVYRPSYGRTTQTVPRQGVFVGTTNESEWNKDPTGGRRFLPVACKGQIDIEAVGSGREQLFAEAVVRYRRGEKWWDIPVDLAQAEQEARYAHDDWASIVCAWLDRTGTFPDSAYPMHLQLPREQINQIELWEVWKYAINGGSNDLGRFGRQQQTQLGNVMVCELGWKKHRIRQGGVRKSVYFRPGHLPVGSQ